MKTSEKLWIYNLVEAIPVALLVFDRNANLLAASPKARAMLLPFSKTDNHNDSSESPALPVNIRESLYRVLKGYSRSESGHATIANTRIEFTVADVGDVVSVAFSDPSPGYDENIDYLSIAAHELKTPLTAIKGGTQLLERTLLRNGDLNDRESKLLGMIISQVNRLSYMVDSLLDTSRLASGRVKLTKSDHDLRAIVQEAVEEVRSSIPGRSIDIKLPSHELRANIDPVRLSQVIENVLRNALENSDPDKAVLVEVYEDMDDIYMTVTDYGKGIQPKDGPHIFEKFYRGAECSGGLGLGLYISSELVKLHGGRIWFESDPGYGTTFYIAIPAR